MSKFSFTIDRSKWRCGGNSDKNSKGMGQTMLRNNAGYQCCLGFACLAAGLKEDDILGIGMPYGLAPRKRSGGLLKLLANGMCNTNFSLTASFINDDWDIGSIEREEKLIKAGQENNIDIDFVGEYENVSQDTANGMSK